MSRLRFTTLMLCSTSIISTPVIADDQAFLKRIEALEAKMEHMSSLEAENKQLKEQLKKTSNKVDQLSSKHLATLKPANSKEQTAYVAIPASNVVAISERLSAVEKQWQGVYAGINAGYSTGDVNTKSSGWIVTTAWPEIVSPSYLGGGSVINHSGPATGGQIGYNYQTSNNLIIGGELDFQYADIRNSTSSTSGNTYNYTLSPTSTNASYIASRTGLDWYGSARARLGYSLGNFMPFISAGFAYGSLSQKENYSLVDTYGVYDVSPPNYYYQVASGSVSDRSNSSVSFGWTAGAGAEYKVAENWSVKGEYLYTSLNPLHAGGPIASGKYFKDVGYIHSSSNTGGWQQSTFGPFGVHQVRLGINYHTGWLDGEAPTVASKH
jgi:outer membrane immunogenic protein